MFDTIMSGGFFERPNNRMGNKANINMRPAGLNNIGVYDFDYYSQLIEGYDNNNTYIWIIIGVIILIFFATLFIFKHI